MKVWKLLFRAQQGTETIWQPAESLGDAVRIAMETYPQLVFPVSAMRLGTETITDHDYVTPGNVVPLFPNRLGCSSSTNNLRDSCLV